MTANSVALVTGAGSGINREVARVLAHDMPVAVCDLNLAGAEETVRLIEAEGGRAGAWQLDVVDGARIRAVVAEVTGRFGPVDTLVNGAGFGQFVPFLEMTEEHWDRMLDVNAKGTFLCTQAVLPAMKEKGYGRIVCFSSVGAMSGSPSHSHYAAAKAAVIGFTKALCKEIGPWGVTINCVAPGAVDTPFLAAVSKEALDRYKASTPVGRMAEPADIAHVVRFLVSPDSGFITGWVISPNGGVYT
jgi:3-oxoacyl-[acyl-carrier protein] reductase